VYEHYAGRGLSRARPQPRKGLSGSPELPPEKAGKGRPAASDRHGARLAAGQSRGIAGVSQPTRAATRSGGTTTVSCTSETSSPATTPATRESSFHAGFQPSKWRDPDSNRGHHDFQTDAPNTRTAAEIPANRLVLKRATSVEVSRNERVDVGLIRTRQGSRVLIDPLLDTNNDGVAASLAIAFRRKRAWLQLVARRSLLVRRGHVGYSEPDGSSGRESGRERQGRSASGEERGRTLWAVAIPHSWLGRSVVGRRARFRVRLTGARHPAGAPPRSVRSLRFGGRPVA
jgi:hypothetical protein